MNKRQIFSENARVRKFIDSNLESFFDELADDTNELSYDEIFDKFNQKYIEFAKKYNADKRNLYTKLDLTSFGQHFKAVETQRWKYIT